MELEQRPGFSVKSQIFFTTGSTAEGFETTVENGFLMGCSSEALGAEAGAEAGAIDAGTSSTWLLEWEMNGMLKRRLGRMLKSPRA